MHNTYTTATNQISTKELRNQLASVVDRVALRGESFVVTKFGMPRAVLMPLSQTQVMSDAEAGLILKESFGSWKQRKDAVTEARKIRRKAERRNAAVSS
jgi:prevent-host-death family protein